MSGGNRRVILNLNERVVSPDHNRHQQISARERSEMMRFLANVKPTNWELGGVLIYPVTTVSTPLSADVFGGLVVLPQVGTSSLFVTEGMLGMYDPDGQAGSSDPNPPNADDSPYKIVKDVGISALGVLTIAANAAGTTRIDIIECRRKETVTETATRDIFNSSTGAYAGVLVNKVSEGQLEYRVRQGVAGAGFPWPNPAQGWLPLAVASVPTGSVSTDTVTFWDVRPLVTDRSFNPGRASHEVMPAAESRRLYADHFTAPPALRVGGHYIGHYNGLVSGGYRAGGSLYKGTPSAVMGTGDLQYVDVHNVENQDPNFAPAGSDIWYLWLCFPFNLPRWMRYNEAAIAGKRYPWGTRGIPVVSSSKPRYDSAHITPPLGVYLPLSTGLDPASAVSVGDPLCIASGCCNAGVPGGFVVDGDWLFPTSKPAPVGPLAGGSLSYDEYHLVAGVDYPHNARVIRVTCAATITTANPFHVAMALACLHVATANTIAIPWQQSIVLTPVAGSIIASWTFDVPIVNPNSVPGLSNDTNFRLYWNIGAGPNKATESCTVLGWRLEG